ncbi:hypothetical protein FACS189465_1950 [Clostridia bacterium]|nr:hypothetical protein FACS189465_1920 [Clostridia bacterium]GHV24593.1 hypothetical protein FACS189465_1950 [Clostridia bacterium]
MGTVVLWIIPTSFYAQIPNSNSSWGTVYCDTYSGGTWIGQTSNTFNVYVVNSNPTFSSSNISYQDTNSTVVAITGDNSKIVRNQSTLAVTFSAATAKNSASISSYQVTFNGSTQSYSSATTINYGTVNSGNNLNLTIKAIDSRGNSTSVTQTITFLDWDLPNAIITAARVNNFENDTNLQVDATTSSVNSMNALQILQYRYKKTSDTDFSDYVDIDNHTQYTISIDNTSAWDFQVLISDKFGSSTYNFIIAKGTPLMFFDTGKISVGINGFPVNDNSFEINGKTIFDMVYPIGAIFLSVNSTNPATYFGGTWVSWGTGRVPVGVDTNDSDFNTAEETGGSKYLQSHNHSTTASLDYTGNYSHNHGNRTDILAEGISDNRDGNYSTGSAVTIGNTGSGNSQNLQPYITCYMWKRTA